MFKRLPNLKRETVTLSFEGEAIEAHKELSAQSRVVQKLNEWVTWRNSEP